MGVPVGWTWFDRLGCRQYSAFLSEAEVEELKAGKLYLDPNGEMLSAIRQALGWQDGTVYQVVEEVARLVTVQAAFQGLFNKVNKVTATWRHQNVVRPADMESLVIRQIEVESFQAPHQPIGKGVAALLPGHEESR